MSDTQTQPPREHVACNLCGSSDHALWAQVRGATLVRCRGCGLVFTNPRLTAAALKAGYEEEYGEVHEDEVLLAQRRRMYEIEQEDMRRWMTDGERRPTPLPPSLNREGGTTDGERRPTPLPPSLDREGGTTDGERRPTPLPPSLDREGGTTDGNGVLTPAPLPRCAPERGAAHGDSKPRFLDVGCGTGEFIAGLQEHFEVYGTDVSQRYISLARERYALPHLFAGELTEAGFAGDFFDVVQMRGVLQHLPDPLGQVREAFRVTKPGGLLVISATPNIASPAARVFGPNFRLLAPDQMVYDFSPRTLRLLLEKAGYRVERVSFPYVGTPYFRWYQPLEFVWLAAKLRLWRLAGRDTSGIRSPAFFGSMMTCWARKG